jgi:hypothetical protein
MAATLQQPLTCHQVLRIAHDDASRVYDDLSDCRIEIRLLPDGWHVDYVIVDPRINGGAPHYVIDPNDGTILNKRYEQ